MIGWRPAVWRKDIKVSDDEVKQDLAQRARAFPGQQKMLGDYYRKNPRLSLSSRPETTAHRD
jgi:FKBP-type peptidyl-prolyl cis-trans isomerase (trigger factor)